MGVLAGFYGAYTYYYRVAPYLEQWISDSGFRNIIGFFILFFAILVVINLIALVVRYFMNIAFLGWVDKFCGTVFGAAKGFLIVSVLLISLTSFLPQGSDIVTKSRLAPHVIALSEMISVFVSSDMKKELQLKLEGAKRAWEEKKPTTRETT